MPEHLSPVIYPLEQVLAIKRGRAEAAEREMYEKQKILQQEQEKLKSIQEQRNKAKQHYTEKLDQLRVKLDHESRTYQLQNSRNYVNLVSEKLKTEEERVQKQQHQVDSAEISFDMAKKKWKQRLKEVEKIDKHRADWLHIALKEFRRAEAKEIEDVGTLIYMSSRLQSGGKSNDSDLVLF